MRAPLFTYLEITGNEDFSEMSEGMAKLPADSNLLNAGRAYISNSSSRQAILPPYISYIAVISIG